MAFTLYQHAQPLSELLKLQKKYKARIIKQASSVLRRLYMKILFFGDLVGDPGRAFFAQQLPLLRQRYNPDIIMVNGENSAPDGRGITPPLMEWFLEQGVALVTTGNHVWAKREINEYIARSKQLLRPANFPSACPGSGVGMVSLADGRKLGVVNLLGRVFMRDLVDCPIKTLQSALSYLKAYTPLVFVDIHAETSAEKAAIANYFDGSVSAVVGTHTHVPTADERILPGGTAFITDVGMGGAIDSMIGMKKEIVIQQFITQMPAKYMVATVGPMQLCAVLITLDQESGAARTIERIHVKQVVATER